MIKRFTKFFKKENMEHIFDITQDEKFLYLKFKNYGNTLQISLKEKKTFNIFYMKKLRDRVLEGIEAREKKDGDAAFEDIEVAKKPKGAK